VVVFPVMGWKDGHDHEATQAYPEQAVRKIREGERLLNEGQDLVEVLRHLEVSEATFNRWRAVYGGMKADEAKRLKTLEVENQRLKKLVAEQALDIDMLKELAEGTSDPGAPSQGCRCPARAFRGFRAPRVPRGRPAPLHATQATTSGPFGGSAPGCSLA
jgi:putative transposase